MWIEKPADHPLRRLKSKHTNGTVVTFNDSGSAQVTEEIGQNLIENYEIINEQDSISD